MTKEQKLAILLQVAVENGWKIEDECMLYFYKIKNLLCFYKDYCSDTEYFSINDLVTNFEEGEISFIEVLCSVNKESTKTTLEENNPDWFTNLEYSNCPLHEIIRIIWITCPTSKRLEWLLETFKHLNT